MERQAGGAERRKTQDEQPRNYKTRVPDGKLELFGGALVNSEALCADYLHRPKSALPKLIAAGMPHIKIGKSARYWFDPPAVLEWFRSQQEQKNQPRTRGNRR